MKRPTIEVEGMEYPVSSIEWFRNGRLCSVSFYDAQGKHQMAFDLSHKTEIEGFDDRGLLHVDLNKRLKNSE